MQRDATRHTGPHQRTHSPSFPPYVHAVDRIVALECECEELKNRVGRHDEHFQEVDTRLNGAYESLLEITDVMGTAARERRDESRFMRSLFATQQAELQELRRLITATAAQSGAAQPSTAQPSTAQPSAADDEPTSLASQKELRVQMKARIGELRAKAAAATARATRFA